MTDEEAQELYQLTTELNRRTEREKLYSYYPDTGPLRRELYAKHLEFFRLGAKYKQRLALCANRVGKAQPLDEPVLTPNGWRAIGSLKPGDSVISGSGVVTTVTGVYSQGELPVYRVSFDDGASTRCCAEHLWIVRQGKAARFGGGDWAVKSLRQIMEHGGAVPRPHLSAMIPLPVAPRLGGASIGIDPYLMGLLLGDGGLSRDHARFSTADVEIAESLARLLPDGCELVHAGGCNYRIAARIRVGRTSPLITLLREAGVWGSRSWDKHVPKQYLMADVETRLAILQGLMDTDGSAAEDNGHLEYCSTSKQLADDTLFLMRSLGIKARMTSRITSFAYKGERKKGRVSYRISAWTTHVPLFRLSRKLAAQRPGERRSVSGKVMRQITQDGTAACVCIAVADPSRSYVTRDWIVTHNTEGMGGYEMTCHLTGIYPPWWEGRRFDKPVVAWVAGETAKDVRDSVQVKLCGPVTDMGTGLIPAANMGRHTAKGGVPDAIDTLYVKHVSGKLSSLAFKSYDQGRESFQAADVDVLWLDEEPPLNLYAEAVTRTMTTLGLVMLTFTPLLGMSETVLQFLPGGEIAERQEDTRAVLMATWQDAPHLTEEMQRAMLDTYPIYQRDARSKGVPQLGAGAIYPVPEDDVSCEPFEIPEHWPRCYALDVGWNRTAALWLAIDRESQTAYGYSEHYRGQAEPSVHAEAIRARGDWIPGVIDPAARGRSQDDGNQLLQQYLDLGLNLTEAENGVESGIYAVWQRLSGGRLKVFKTCQNFFKEYRLYRRDDKGRIVKVNDHLLDCCRYGVVSGLALACVKPVTDALPFTSTGKDW